jgi:hypothetical protein
LRQMVARAAQAEMVRQGTRINDLGIFARANRRSDMARTARVQLLPARSAR